MGKGHTINYDVRNLNLDHVYDLLIMRTCCINKLLVLAKKSYIILIQDSQNNVLCTGQICNKNWSKLIFTVYRKLARASCGSYWLFKMEIFKSWKKNLPIVVVGNVSLECCLRWIWWFEMIITDLILKNGTKCVWKP